MPPTIGETLTQARLDRKLTIKAASEATAIRVKFLEALEADEFDSLPSPVQARGFLRIYADYLGLDSGDLLILLMGESTSVEESTEDSVSQPETPVEESDLPETSENEIKVPLAEEVERQSTDVDFVELPSVDLGEDDLDIQSQNFNLPLPLSSSIFIEIGQQLRGRRELLSLTLDEIEQHTHIRKHYLLSMEAGAIDNLPSPVQARGILSSYARFLDLDSESLLLRFAEGLQAKRLERHPRQPRTKHENGGDAILPPGLRRILSTDLVFGGSMILAMIAFAIWGANRIISQSEFAQGSVNSEQSISEALLAPTLATEEVTVLPSPSLEVVITSVNVNNTPTIIEIPTLAKSSPVQVVTAITGNTWMRVKVDGEIKFQGIANAGSAYTFNGEEKIEVRAADGSLVQIFYNGKDQGLMGDSGAITEIIYNSLEALLPTPTSTPTPTRTPRVTPTYTPSITPTPTDLPEPSE
jgi:cytoskeleton protein RodZ